MNNMFKSALFCSVLLFQGVALHAYTPEQISTMIDDQYRTHFAQFYIGSIDQNALNYWQTLMLEANVVVKNSITMDKNLTNLWNTILGAHNTLSSIIERWNNSIKSRQGAADNQSDNTLTSIISTLQQVESSPALNKSYMLSGNNKAVALMRFISERLLAMAKATQSQIRAFKTLYR